MEREEILKTLHHFKEHNKSKYQILRLGIFGSVARGVMSSDSDVDIVVELKEPDLFYLIGIKQDLEEQLHRPVDIVRYRDKMNAFLRQKIDQEAVYV
jgi:hypothetical protein